MMTVVNSQAVASQSAAHRPHPVDLIPMGGIVTVRDRLLELQAQGRTVMRLESGDPSFDIAPHVREAIEKALRDGHTHYTAGAGIPGLRKAIFEKLRTVNRIAIKDANHVLVTNGAMHALYITFRALCSDGEEVIVPDPTWTETADNVRLAGGIAVGCRTTAETGYKMTAAAVEPLITPRTCAIVLNTPHNPTGAVLDRQTLTDLLDLAHRHNLKIVSDEAYEHVIYDGLEHVSIGSLPGAEGRVISIYSYSKSYAMSGLRVGYVACDDDLLMERMAKLTRCTINGVNSATQYGAIAALTGPQDFTVEMNRVYQHRRDLLLKGLERLTFLKPFKPDGAFYVWAAIDPAWEGIEGKRDGWAMTHWLLDTFGVGSAPGEVFGPAGAGHVRFAFSCATDHIERAVAAFERM
jgi:aspartate aminotransferase